MKVKDLVTKVFLINTEVTIKERNAVLGTYKVPIKECEYLDRTITTFQPYENKIVIFLKPL